MKNKLKIRIEVSSLASRSISGVGNYTKMLAEALDGNVETHASYFNFLDRQPEPQLSLKGRLEKNSLIPLRIYAKLQSYGLAPPFDFFLPKVDLTIFPNFATWPSTRTKYRATVIHDLTYLYFPEVVQVKNLAHLHRVVPRSIKQADFIITVSETVKAELVKEFLLPPDKCVVTTVPPDSIYFQKNTNEIHKKYGIPTQKFIYFVGNLEPRKDLPTLIEAYRKLPASMKEEYSLVLAGGNGWKTEKSRQSLAEAQADGENVVHVGFVDSKDAAAFYQHASLFVMPSIYEGFGMPILEAMASKTPTLVSDIKVFRELSDNASQYFAVSNPVSLRNGIVSILNDTKKQELLIESGLKRALSFSWDKNAEVLVNYLNKLTSQ